MLDIKMIRENTAAVRERLATRGAGDEKKIDEALGLDEKRRSLLSEVEKLKAERNRVSKEIGALMGQKEARRSRSEKSRNERHRRQNFGDRQGSCRSRSRPR
jgi:seryl-tRNA synthetase